MSPAFGHAGMTSRRRTFHGYDGNLPALQFAQRVEEVNRRATPSRKLGHEDDIDLPRLCQRHDLSPLGAIELRTGPVSLKIAAIS